jgi:hypothetical protein
MPKSIADYYGLNNGILNNGIGSVISYTNKDDIISQIKSHSGVEYKRAMQQIRDNTYERNCRMLDIIFDKNTSNLSDFKIEYCNNIKEYIDLYAKIFNSIPSIKDRLNNKTIIDIDSNTTIFNIVCFSISPNCKFINFIKDLERAKYYKKLMTYNNLLDNTTIYNNTVGKMCKSGKPDKSGTQNTDMFTLDSLNLQDISLIHMNSNQADDIIIGANNLIKTQTPILLIKYDKNDKNDNDNNKNDNDKNDNDKNDNDNNKNDKNDERLILNNLGYTYIQHENYSIYYHLSDILC